MRGEEEVDEGVEEEEEEVVSRRMRRGRRRARQEAAGWRPLLQQWAPQLLGLRLSPSLSFAVKISFK